MSIPLPAVALIQRSLDILLSKSPESRQPLIALDGHVVEFNLTGLATSIYLIFRDAGVEVCHCFDGEVDAVFIGTPLALASMTRGNHVLLKGDVTMEGDVSVGRKIKELSGSIELDPEEELSHIVGDALAHQTARFHRSLMGWLTRTTGNNALNVGDYLQEEIRLTPTRYELEHFYGAVDDLRGDLDRLEKRIELLGSTSESAG